MKVVPAGDVHLDAMAMLLAEGHDRLAVAGARHVLADRQTARAAVEAAVRTGPGVVTIDGAEVVGFMIVPLPARPGTTTARLGIADHAARPEGARSIYRQQYEAVGDVVIKLGCTYHSLPVPVGHADVVATFFGLEFGLDQIDGILPVEGLRHPAATTGAVRFARPDDVDAIIDLAIELVKYHSRPPMFQVALMDVRSIRRSIEESLENHRCAVVVAESQGRVVAMAQAEPDRAYVDAFDIGMNIVTAEARGSGIGSEILDVLLQWGAAADYWYCTVGWTSSNLVSDAFYRAKGFSPTRYRLHRRIDTRVSWANEGLDYTVFQQ